MNAERVNRLLSVATAATLIACGGSMGPFVVEQVDAHVYRFRQPQNAAEWQAVRDAGVTDIVKLNAPDEGPAGFSDDYAAQLGMDVHVLTIEPRGDGPILAQIEGVFEKPDPAIAAQADALLDDATKIVGVHCTHGWDRTGFEVAKYRVRSGELSPSAAHREWHQHAQYIPYGVRVPSPGLEEAWDDFVDAWWKAQGKP